MQAKDAYCLQCQKFALTPSNRLVQDSCGHKKCRSCLLNDVEQCKQCIPLNTNNTDRQDVCQNTDYHTAVIQCNGKAKLNCDRITENGEGENEIGNVKENLINQVKNDEPKNEKTITKKRAITIPSHVTVKSDPISYFCTVCNKTFLTKSHVKYHQFCGGEFKPYKCATCSKEFITKTQLNLHMYNHGDVKPFSCSICQKSFLEKTKLSRHMILHSSEKKYSCPECGKAFKSKESLRVHSLIHSNEKPYTCNVCSSKFNNSSNLKKHLVSHTSERTHMCDTCGRRFKLKWSLSVHKKSHLKVRSHQCNICSKSFVNQKDLQRHNLIHAETKGYACGICRTGFRRKDNLHRHMKNSHPGKTAEVIERRVRRRATPTEGSAGAAVVVDNPNAINVITTAPLLDNGRGRRPPTPRPLSPKSTDSRRPSGAGVSVINGPIKLAFKTPAFKSHYNIARDCNFVPPAQIAKPLPLSESVDIANKLLEPNDSPRITRTETISTEIYHKILSLPSHSSVEQPPPKPNPPPPIIIPQTPSLLPPYSSPFHYETSFQNRKHAMIKNIKFKVPEQYTNLFKQNNNNNNNKSTETSIKDDSGSCATPNTENTSVIVNSSGQSSDLHWRRRTSQNLVLKN